MPAFHDSSCAEGMDADDQVHLEVFQKLICVISLLQLSHIWQYAGVAIVDQVGPAQLRPSMTHIEKTMTQTSFRCSLLQFKTADLHTWENPSAQLLYLVSYKFPNVTIETVLMLIWLTMA